MNEILMTHPDNRAELEAAFSKPWRGFFGYEPLFSIGGIPLEYNSHMERRQVKETWHPPTDRFVEYGQEDEAWMRFFGLGRIECEDVGPLIVKRVRPLFFSDYGFRVKAPLSLVKCYT